jgi:hypothetical protein
MKANVSAAFIPLLILASLLALQLAGIMGSGAATYAQADPWPVTLTMSGPATAVSGQDVSYRVHYHLTDPAVMAQTGFRIDIPRHTTPVSTQVVSGSPGVFGGQEEEFVVWGALGNAEEPAGEVELVVKIDADFVGSIFGWAYVPGTNTTQSNIVETEVFAPGSLPEAGGGPAVDYRPLVAAAIIALVGGMLVCTSAAVHHLSRTQTISS